MDYQAALGESKAFYEAHGLTEWVDALPASISPSGDGTELLEKAKQLGLDHALVFPDFGTQMKLIATVIDEMAMNPVEGVEVSPKFARPYISDDWSKEPSGRVYQAEQGLESRKAGPYMLLYNLDSVPEQTLGRKGNQIARLFREQGWSGFTAPELLAAVRRWREQSVLNGAVADSRMLEKFYWVWLVDSGDSEKSSAAFYGLQGIGVYGCKVGSANKQRGANVTVVVPL